MEKFGLSKIKKFIQDVKLSTWENVLQNNKQAKARISAIKSLEKMGSNEAKQIITKGLMDPDRDVRLSSVNSLDALNWQPGMDKTGAYYFANKQDWQRCIEIGVEAIDPISSILRYENDFKFIENAIITLGEIRDECAIGSLSNHLNTAPINMIGGDDETRANLAQINIIVAQAFEKIGSKKAVEHLFSILNHKEGIVREATAKALDSLGWNPDKSENGASYYVAKKDWGKCIEFSELAVEPLITLLSDENELLRVEASKTLVKIGKPAIEPLLSLYSIPTDFIKQMFVFIPPIIDESFLRFKLYSYKSIRECEMASRILSEIGDDQVLKQLRKIFKKGIKELRQEAESTLQQIFGYTYEGSNTTSNTRCIFSVLDELEKCYVESAFNAGLSIVDDNKKADFKTK